MVPRTSWNPWALGTHAYSRTPKPLALWLRPRTPPIHPSISNHIKGLLDPPTPWTARTPMNPAHSRTPQFTPTHPSRWRAFEKRSLSIRRKSKNSTETCPCPHRAEWCPRIANCFVSKPFWNKNKKCVLSAWTMQKQPDGICLKKNRFKSNGTTVVGSSRLSCCERHLQQSKSWAMIWAIFQCITQTVVHIAWSQPQPDERVIFIFLSLQKSWQGNAGFHTNWSKQKTERSVLSCA